jgi:hydroxymethylglutaryl-CoA lyase
LKAFDVASFASPKLVPQLADAAEVLRLMNEDPVLSQVSMTCIVPSRRQLDRFFAATKGLSLKNLTVSVWVHASEEFSQVSTKGDIESIGFSTVKTQRNMGFSIEHHLNENRQIARDLAGTGVKLRAYVSGAIYCPYSGRVAPEKCAELATELAGIGVEELVLADTLGRGLVHEVREALLLTQQGLPKVPVGLHLHNTYGYALGVISMAAELGVRSFECSVAGLGGCPFAGPQSLGNVATEDVAGLLSHLGFETGVDLKKLVSTGRWISEIVGVQPTSCLSKFV